MKNKQVRGLYNPHNGNPPFWVYGYYTHVAGDAMFPERHIIHTDVGLMDVDPATVGELVGFFYGFEVFEGDIIHLKGKEYDKDFGVVRWHENGYFYIDDSFGEFPKDYVKPVGDFFDSISTDFKGTQITVSGNIHDRPELWKGGAR